MKNGFIIEQTEQASILGASSLPSIKNLFSEGRFLKDSFLPQHSTPFMIAKPGKETAEGFLKEFGSKRDVYYEEDDCLLLTEKTAAKMFSFCLQAPVETARPLPSGQILAVLNGDEVHFGKRAVYGAFVKNVRTAEYDLLFTTDVSPLLAVTRAREKAQEREEYDSGDVLLRQFQEDKVTWRSNWGPLGESGREVLLGYQGEHPDFDLPQFSAL